jgi:two-component system nitrate/nitrite sensor histidine kinase NarX
VEVAGLSLRKLKWFTIILPPLIIGGFELIRHEFMLHYLSMEVGNFYIILLTFILSFIFANWMFRNIAEMNESLAGEQAKRAVYEERERLAQELHDNIAQNVFFLNVQLKRGKTEEARSAVAEIDHHLRQAIFNLRSLPEDGISFVERIVLWVQQWEAMTGVDVAQKIEWQNVKLSASQQVQLFSVVQEAFTNIRKHSQATSAVIELTESAETWTLRIRDDGLGLEGTQIGPSQYGISMMRKRVQELEAEFTIRTAVQDGGGTEVIILGRKQRVSIDA